MSKYPRFGQVVRDQMRTLGIKAKAVAEALEVRAQAVSAYRNGAYRPEEPRLGKLSRLLKVSRETLLSDDQGAPGAATYGDDAPPSVPLSEIVRRTTENLQSLAEIRAYAVAVRNMLWNAGHQQDRVVEMLEPHVRHEQQHPDTANWRVVPSDATAAYDEEVRRREKAQKQAKRPPTRRQSKG